MTSTQSKSTFDTPWIMTSLQNAPLERPTCFAFPERGSSWPKYYQPSGYHYYANEPALLNMLCMPGVMYSMHQHRYHEYNRQAYKIYDWLVWVNLIGWLVLMFHNATCTAVIDNINERITCNIACNTNNELCDHNLNF